MSKIHLKKGADVYDLIGLMHQYNQLFRDQGYLLLENDIFHDPESPADLGKMIFAMLKRMNYRADSPRKQIIKTPYRLLLDQSGDCKSYSIFAASLLQAAGIPVRFVFSNRDGSGKPDHVFVQFADGDNIYTLDGTICCFNTYPPAARIFVDKWMQ